MGVFTHDMARSKAYRWGEDGIAGICDRYQLLVFALALWNGRDPILKERMFGLSGSEGNHGEDVKEYWFYLDNTPTHSYMRMLYKYPQREFPYAQLLEENRRRQAQVGAPEYELLDTGIFDDNRYFDVFVEYAKSGPEDICIESRHSTAAPRQPTFIYYPTCGSATRGLGPIHRRVSRSSVSNQPSTTTSRWWRMIFRQPRCTTCSFPIRWVAVTCMPQQVGTRCSQTMKATRCASTKAPAIAAKRKRCIPSPNRQRGSLRKSGAAGDQSVC